MKKLAAKSLFLVLILFCSSLVSSNTKPYLAEERVSYVEKVLRSITSAKLQNIYNIHSYINVVDRNNCASSLSSLRTQCLIQFATDNCQGLRGEKQKEHCELYSDIIVVNKLSEDVFIPRNEKYRLLKNNSGDSREILSNRLEQKYSRLVTQFSLTSKSECDVNDYQCLAKGLDEFCLEYTNKQSLSWQYCMSAVVWFIGTSR